MKKVLLFVFLLITLFLIFSVWWMFQEETVQTSTSPDGRYLLVVLTRNLDSYFPIMPGQGSDVECFVELRKTKRGDIILRKSVDMLQNVDNIQWDVDRVWINSCCAILYNGEPIGLWCQSDYRF